MRQGVVEPLGGESDVGHEHGSVSDCTHPPARYRPARTSCSAAPIPRTVTVPWVRNTWLTARSVAANVRFRDTNTVVGVAMPSSRGGGRLRICGSRPRTAWTRETHIRSSKRIENSATDTTGRLPGAAERRQAARTICDAASSMVRPLLGGAATTACGLCSPPRLCHSAVSSSMHIFLLWRSVQSLFPGRRRDAGWDVVGTEQSSKKRVANKRAVIDDDSDDESEDKPKVTAAKNKKTKVADDDVRACADCECPSTPRVGSRRDGDGLVAGSRTFPVGLEPCVVPIPFAGPPALWSRRNLKAVLGRAGRWPWSALVFAAPTRVG